MGKFMISTGPFSIAKLVYQRVCLLNILSSLRTMENCLDLAEDSSNRTRRFTEEAMKRMGTVVASEMNIEKSSAKIETGLKY